MTKQEKARYPNYRRLQTIRRWWCRRKVWPEPDRSDVEIILDSSKITDIPSFHIALGEAVNGPGGYYGACLDALEDCLCGRFGLIPPFRLVIPDIGRVRKVIDESEPDWYAALFCDLSEEERREFYGDSEPDSFFREGVTYSDALWEILASRRVQIVESSDESFTPLPGR
jgi:RNAse (barnase) inhibitor barstar